MTEDEEEARRRERNRKKKLRRQGKLLDSTDRAAIERALALHASNAALLVSFDRSKLKEWNDFVLAFERLWAGSFYLPEEASDVLNGIQREIANGIPVFEQLSAEVEG